MSYSFIEDFSNYLLTTFLKDKNESDLTEDELIVINQYFEKKIDIFNEYLERDLKQLISKDIKLQFKEYKIIFGDLYAQCASCIKINFNITNKTDAFELSVKYTLFHNQINLFISTHEFEKITNKNLKKKLEKALDHAFYLP